MASPPVPDEGGPTTRGRPPRPSSLPGHVHLLDVVGRGAGSTVWRARDRRRGRDVAVKVIDLGASDASLRRSRFESELRSLARLSGQPHVLSALAAGSDESRAWIMTPLAEASLIEVVGRDGPSGAVDCTTLLVAVAGALEAAHLLDIVHGDVTPANVLILEGSPVLADFGLAALRSGPGDGPAAATPGWAAPEVLDGQRATPAADVYGLGATAWTASTGERCSPACPPDPSVLPRGISEMVAACCDPDPSKRPRAGEVRARAEAERRRRSRYCPDP